MQEVVILNGARTAVGKFGGAFKDVSAPTLGATVIREALHRSQIDPAAVDEVIMGNALQAAEAGYAARLASLRAGIPEDVPTIAVNIEVIIPIANGIANPLTGPLPTAKRIIAAINVVMFASAIAYLFIAKCPSP